MYFAYFQSYVPQKSLMMDNYWIIMEFYGNKISKCPSLMEKSAPILGHRLLPSLSNKQLIINTFLRSPCMITASGQYNIQSFISWGLLKKCGKWNWKFPQIDSWFLSLGLVQFLGLRQSLGLGLEIETQTGIVSELLLKMWLRKLLTEIQSKE